MTRYLSLEISKNKNTEYLTPDIKTIIMKMLKINTIYTEFDTMQKAQKVKKKSFPKNADLHNPVLNKIMTT